MKSWDRKTSGAQAEKYETLLRKEQKAKIKKSTTKRR